MDAEVEKADHAGLTDADIDPLACADRDPQVRILQGSFRDANPGWPDGAFHDLRHSAASLLIASGVELAEVSMLLGHSELRVTMDFYAHLQQQTAAKAARQMASILG